MHTSTIVLLAVIAVVLVAAVMWITQRRSSKRLRSKFGPEYTRAVQDTGAARKAEAQLQQREKRVGRFTILALTPADRDRYIVAWRKIQAQFVDNPKDAVTRADALLGEVMTVRGYPIGDFDQRSADLSVDHPVVVQNYRAGHDIAVRHARGEAGTEELRQAMLHYRSLFDELLEQAVEPATPAPAHVV